MYGFSDSRRSRNDDIRLLRSSSKQLLWASRCITCWVRDALPKEKTSESLVTELLFARFITTECAGNYISMEDQDIIYVK